MARPHVPKFGNWENKDNIPYTAYFDKAREGRNGKIKNPNEPQENNGKLYSKISPPHVQPKPPAPQVQSKFPPPKLVIPPEEPIVRGPVRTTHEHKKSRENAEEPIVRGQVRTIHERKKITENAEFKKFSESPARNENMNRKSDRPTRRSHGSERSVENLPLHPKYQAKVAPKVGDLSPSRDVKSSYESIYGTPRRTRDGPANYQGRRTPGRGAAIPRFGSWDEKDTSSAADGYTQIFNRKREERLTGTIKSPKRVYEPSYTPRRKYHDDDDVKSCCFPWGRK